MKWNKTIAGLAAALLLSATVPAAVLFTAVPLSAQIIESIDHAQEYSACMSLARSVPEQAYESAQSWEKRGGGAAAQHCLAVSLLAMGQYQDAGQAFEALAEAMPAENAELRADVLAQAGQAWLLAGNTERAYAVQTTALTLHPNDAELLIDRAVTLATAENYWEAIDDLNKADELSPDRADILIFRASAYRYVEAFDLAQEDARRALELDPDNPEGLLERGILRRLTGDAAGAREDWLKVVTLAEGTPAADAAQANLEALDVKVEQ